MYLPRIDRIYASWGPWQLIHLNTRTNTICELAKARSTCDSDHAPVSTKITRKPRGDKANRPIPTWKAKHALFKTTVLEYLEHCDLNKTPNPYEAAKHLKQIFKKASQETIAKIYAKTTLNRRTISDSPPSRQMHPTKRLPRRQTRYERLPRTRSTP